MYDLLDEYQRDDKSRTFINPVDRVHPQELGGFVMMYIIAKAQGLGGINAKTEIAVSSDSATVSSGTATDANSEKQPITVTVSKHTPQNETLVLDEGFNNGVGKWKPMMIGALNTDDYGSTDCDYTIGSNLPNGSGAGAAKIEIGINKARNYYTLAEHMPVLAGQKLDVSASVKTENVRSTDTVDMSVIFCDKEDKVISNTETKISDDVKGTHDWQKISGSVTVPDGAWYMRIDVSARCMTTDATEKQGTVWFDDVRVSSKLNNADGNVITLNNADTENKVSSNQSLLVNGGANANGVTYSSEPIMVTGTQKYLFGAYAKKDTGVTGKISIEAYSSQGTKLDTTEVDVESADFAKAEREITMPENAVYAVVKLNAANGNMNVDDLCLSKITSERDRAYSFTGTPGEVSVYAEDGIIIIATYNADKSLQSIVISGSVKANDPISEITVEENQKAFVWTSLNDMKPVGTKHIKKN